MKFKTGIHVLIDIYIKEKSHILNKYSSLLLCSTVCIMITFKSMINQNKIKD